MSDDGNGQKCAVSPVQAGEGNYTSQARKASTAHSERQEKAAELTIRKESWYQARILRYLRTEYPAGVIWKAAAGQYSQGGIPDVCAVIDGTFYGFEVKRPGGRVTALQAETIRRINRAGGVAGVVTTVEDVEKLIKDRR